MSEIKLYGRSLARAQAFQILFQAHITKRTVENVLQNTPNISDGPLSEYGRMLSLGTDEHLDAIDKCISSCCTNWQLDRINNVDLSLLRLAIFEMLYVDDVEASVTINEIVELSKMFGTDDSYRFINGNLGQIARLIESGSISRVSVESTSDEQ